MITVPEKNANMNMCATDVSTILRAAPQCPYMQRDKQRNNPSLLIHTHKILLHCKLPPPLFLLWICTPYTYAGVCKIVVVWISIIVLCTVTRIA